MTALCHFDDIIQRIADAVLIVLGTGRVVYANPAAEAMFGWSARPSAQLPILGAGTSEIRLPSVDRHERVAEMRVVETVWEGQPAWLASLREITDRKHATDALRFLADASRRWPDCSTIRPRSNRSPDSPSRIWPTGACWT